MFPLIDLIQSPTIKKPSFQKLSDFLKSHLKGYSGKDDLLYLAINNFFLGHVKAKGANKKKEKEADISQSLI